ncbi:hypothetical protein [Streptomyces sp. cg36]|uniref:hypothetical protein n=1 Tax=Streptomyces sp. cg36 TaxID=3238798 RepID=UPI0034E1D557
MSGEEILAAVRAAWTISAGVTADADALGPVRRCRTVQVEQVGLEERVVHTAPHKIVVGGYQVMVRAARLRNAVSGSACGRGM